MKLVIVESPNKVKKIQEYLGAGFEVHATAGHFRDLPRSELGVDLTTFEPSYEVADDKKGLLQRIKTAAAKAEEVLLATDADREGEAISWHLTQALRLKSARRIRFQEITAKALTSAVKAAGPLDQKLVDAQQARRVLDRLVGYQVSPLLSVLGRNHSAGRVQTATLHLVVLREQTIESFVRTSYWTLAARYENGLTARYAELTAEGELTDVRLKSEDEAKAIVSQAQGPHVVKAVDTKPVERKPKPPFTTSTLQQAASVQLSLKPDKTMQLAQRLFEGGHITYHRSDSVALSADAIAMAREFIARDFPAALPPVPPTYTSKASAQEAHEAIRPTSLAPDAAAELSGDELALYNVIRARFLACQCKPAVFSQTTIAITSGTTTWRARGSTPVFLSFLKYLGADEDTDTREDEEQKLPPVKVGDVLALAAIDIAGKETKPPSRFTQATLIREMEKVGIGRPSTYAATLATLFAREYLAEEKKFVLPAPRGRLIDEVLAHAFQDLVRADYTAAMEERLDEVAAGKCRWKDELRSWYGPFAQQLQAAPALLAQEVERRPELKAVAPEAPQPTGKKCPRCSSELLLRQGKRGPFLSCSSYPKCDYAADRSARPSERPCPRCGGALEELEGKHGAYVRCLTKECGYSGDPKARPCAKPCPKCGKAMEEVGGKYGKYARCLTKDCDGKLDLDEKLTDHKCPVCEAPMRLKQGKFLSCSRYPECRGSWSLNALESALKTNRHCPKCRRLLTQKKGAKGKFWGCSGYPTCTFTEAISTPAKSDSPKRSSVR